MEEADAHQLRKTVDLLSMVHNLNQALIRIFLMILYFNVYVINSVPKTADGGGGRGPAE
jgi:hypothetical protein